MTEQTQTYRLPGDAERGESFSRQTPELVEARDAAQSSANIRGDLREVRATDPEARINLDEEDSTGAFWRQQEAEKRLLAQRQYRARTSHQERMAAEIDRYETHQSVSDIAQISMTLVNFRTYEAA